MRIHRLPRGFTKGTLQNSPNQVSATLTACPRAMIGLYETASRSPQRGDVPGEKSSLVLITSVIVGRNRAREALCRAKPCMPLILEDWDTLCWAPHP